MSPASQRPWANIRAAAISSPKPFRPRFRRHRSLARAVKVVVSAGASDIRIEADDNLIDLVVAETRGKTSK